MRTRILLIISMIGALTASCDLRGNYIVLKSVDGDQIVRRDAAEVQIVPNAIIDTSLLYEMVRGDNISDSSFALILASTPNSGSFVMRIDTKEGGVQGKYFVSLFAEGNRRRIEKLYLLEGGQGALSWHVLKDAYSIKTDTTNKRVKISAIVKVIIFNGSFSIRFPYNDRGSYNWDIDRYMTVECGFSFAGDSSGCVFPDNSVSTD